MTGAPALTHHTAKVNDIDLRYVVAGCGPPVFLLHGFPEFWTRGVTRSRCSASSSPSWRPICAATATARSRRPARQADDGHRHPRAGSSPRL